jgi:hypothetical protein
LFIIVYIDTPLILDEISVYYPYRTRNGNRHRKHLLKNLSKSFDDVSAIDEILAKQLLLQHILLNICNVVSGEFQQIKDDWVFREEGLNILLGYSIFLPE